MLSKDTMSSNELKYPEEHKQDIIARIMKLSERRKLEILKQIADDKSKHATE